MASGSPVEEVYVRQANRGSRYLTKSDQKEREKQETLLKILEDTRLTFPRETKVFTDLDEFYEGFDDAINNHKDKLIGRRPILVTGETSSGKSSFVNHLIGHNILPVKHLHCTSRIILIQRGSPLQVGNQCFEGDNVKDATKAAAVVTKEIKKLQEFSEVDTIDVCWPFESAFLKDDIILVDTPGIGETEEISKRVFNYMPKAVACIFVINASNAGGVQEERMERIMREQLSHMDNIKLLQPERAIFLCNKWEAVPEDEDQEVWEDTLRKLTFWPRFKEKQATRLSLIRDKDTQALRMKNGEKYLKDAQRMVQNLINESLNERCDVALHWIETLCQDVEKRRRFQEQIMEKETEEKRKLQMAFKKEKESINQKAEENARLLCDQVGDIFNSLNKELHQHLLSDAVRIKLQIWSDEEAKILLRKHDDEGIRKTGREMVSKKVEEEVQLFLSQNQDRVFEQFKTAFSEKSSEMIVSLDKFQNPFTAQQVSDKEIITSSDEYSKTSSFGFRKVTAALPKPAKVAIMATIPLWMPFVIVAAIAGGPIVATRELVVKNIRRRDMKKVLEELTKEFYDNLPVEQPYFSKEIVENKSRINRVFRDDVQRQLRSLDNQYKDILNEEEIDIMKNECRDLDAFIQKKLGELEIFKIDFPGQMVWYESTV